MRGALDIEALAPLALRAGRSTERSDTLAYLPGWALIGAFATAHRLLREDKAQFTRFFCAGRIRFGDGYPADFGKQELQGYRWPVTPLPLTARSCKRWGGFAFESELQRERHGVHDSLIPWALFVLSEGGATAPLNALRRCAKCPESMDHFSGFYRCTAQGRQFGLAELKRHLLTRVGINRSRLTAETSMLYNRQVIARGQHLWAALEAPDDLFEEFTRFVEEANTARLLRIGTSRTRGLGAISISTRPLRAAEGDSGAVERRCRAFDDALRQAARAAGVATPHALYVPLTLTAHVLLPDGLGGWRGRLDDLELAGLGLDGARLLYQCAEMRRLSGWSGLLGLPRADEVAIAMGSVFLVGFEERPDFGTLSRLEREGIGVRRAEGFGSVRVADRFHVEANGL